MVQLSENAKRVLRLMMESRVMSGGELFQRSRLSPNDLSDALRTLVDERLIQTNVMGFDQSSLPDAYFNVIPSALSLAKMLAS
jgi:hypothetical protein